MAISNLASADFIKGTLDTTGITLFGYGSGTNGAPVFDANGLAYIGKTPLDGAAGTQTNITVTPSSDISKPWQVHANSSTTSFNKILDFNDILYMYIIPSSASFEQVGFATISDVPAGGVTTGFTLFGKSVAYAASESSYQLGFWALATNTTGVYGLYWNAGTALEGAFPVTIKSTPPTVV
ncbi:uncharacterized protein BP5553_04949 [Venustampulla echinocandica]|uniref:Uncharacterized protein n=1 Tax=Venustampulla echinocandica TaxID=2656787 RepID=A0A370TPR4_9HELO|nr:uncharacterized protein BP5553_04949 [Venustampulla echinocandica]RDL37516.1 hypothetical protein BP5553_04949 [Venustampulla echinocandica]